MPARKTFRHFLARSSPDDALQWGIAAVFVTALLAINLAWLLADTSLLTMTDSYGYLYRLLRFVDTFDPSAPSKLWQALGELSAGGRPPLYQLATVPFVVLFGRSEDAALAVNLLFLAILAVGAFGAGSLVGGFRAGLLTSFLACTYPPIVHLHRTYSTYVAVPALVALAIWALIGFVKTRSVGSAWFLSLSLAAGLLSHPSFSYIVGPVVLVVVPYVVLFQCRPRVPESLAKAPRWLASKLGSPLVIRGLLPASLLAMALPLLWYLTHGRPILRAYRVIESAQLAEFRGFAIRALGFPEIQPSFWWYAKTAPGTLSIVLTLACLAALLFALARPSAHLLIPALGLLTSYAALSQLSSLAWIRFSGALPLAAFLTAFWVSSLSTRWLRVSLTALLIATGTFNYVVVTWGAGGAERFVGPLLGARIDMPGCRLVRALCPVPPRREDWRAEEILRRVMDDECVDGRCDSLLVIQGNYTYYLYQKQRLWPDRELEVLTPGGRSFGAQYDFDALMRADFILVPASPYKFRRRPEGGGFDYHRATVRFLHGVAPPEFAEAHRQVSAYELPNGRTVHLIKRIAPLSADEARGSLEALELDEKYKKRGHRQLKKLVRETNGGELD